MKQLLTEARHAELLKQWGTSDDFIQLYAKKWLPYSNSTRCFVPSETEPMQVDTASPAAAAQSVATSEAYDSEEAAKINKTIQYECFVAVVNTKQAVLRYNKEKQVIEEDPSWRFSFSNCTSIDLDFARAAGFCIHYDPVFLKFLPECKVYDYTKDQADPLHYIVPRIGQSDKYTSMIKLGNIKGDSIEQKVENHSQIWETARKAVVRWQQSFYSASKLKAQATNKLISSKDDLQSKTHMYTPAANTAAALPAAAAATMSIEELKEQIQMLSKSKKDYARFSKQFVFYSGYHGDVTCIKDNENGKLYAVKTFVDKKGQAVTHRAFNHRNPELANLETMERIWKGYHSKDLTRLYNLINQVPPKILSASKTSFLQIEDVTQ